MSEEIGEILVQADDLQRRIRELGARSRRTTKAATFCSSAC